MKYLIDTDWVADYLNGKPGATALINSLPQDELAISLITYGEIYEGIYFGRDPKRHEQVLLAFIRGIRVVPLNRRIMRQFARIRGNLRQSGQLIGHMDILIAATAITYNLTLITSNTKHYSRVPGLSIF